MILVYPHLQPVKTVKCPHPPCSRTAPRTSHNHRWQEFTCTNCGTVVRRMTEDEPHARN